MFELELPNVHDEHAHPGKELYGGGVQQQAEYGGRCIGCIV